jgi:hypothetical protein
MRTLTFIYTADGILQDVKQESSMLAVRYRDQEGWSTSKEDDSYFDMLVFDEAYEDKFKELFLDAQAEVVPALSAYMRHVAVDPVPVGDDFTLALALPDQWNAHLQKSLQTKIRQHLISYIMYRWLETKLNQEASAYLARATSVLEEAKKLLNVRTEPMRRWIGYW